MRLEHDVMVDMDVWDALHAQGLRVLFDPKQHEYPMVVDKAGNKRGDLHVQVAIRVFGAAAVAGHDVHHKSANKRDNRIRNLALKTRADHAKMHVIDRKAKRRTDDVQGLWRPRQRGRVDHLDPDEARPEHGGKTLREVYADPRTWDDAVDRLVSRRDLLRDAERRLEQAYGRLKDEVSWFATGNTIPRQTPSVRWNDVETKRLGLREPTLACTKAEAALVFALVKHESLVTGELDVDASAADVAVQRGIVRIIMKHLPVNVALDRWRRYGRLPHVSRRSS